MSIVESRFIGCILVPNFSSVLGADSGDFCTSSISVGWGEVSGSICLLNFDLLHRKVTIMERHMVIVTAIEHNT